MKSSRIQSIDLLRGIVMIIMALDHTRDYFHHAAFLFSPEDLSCTSPAIFATRWSTHFCAPVFVFLAGLAAYQYGEKKGRHSLSFFLFTRGLWLVMAELLIVSFAWTFNPNYPFFNLQVLWATGISMMALAGIIHLNRWVILLIGLLLTAGHNLLDQVHATGNGIGSFAWSLLHEPGRYHFGGMLFVVRYPVLPWTGIIVLGYFLGQLYSLDAKKRKAVLGWTGIVATILFVILRAANVYGDPLPWQAQKNNVFTMLSFLNVTKYPPSLLYSLMTIGPSLVFLALAEMPLNKFTAKITIIGRVPMFYYLLHLFLIHTLAMIAAALTGYDWNDMVLTTRVNAAPQLSGYGFNLGVVYFVWLLVVLLLFPLCKKFDAYKRAHQATKWWLRYL